MESNMERKEKLKKKKVISDEVKKYINNEVEKERQKMIFGICIIDNKGDVLKIEDISDDEWKLFLKHIKQSTKALTYNVK